MEHFEILDVYKALISMVAGLILGFERERKDKSAGLKTITVICLGSTLFSILSYKISGHGDPGRIASYVVSGIGFLGAGVIFKTGYNVYGLTTAGIIWIAAAIGMAIGFGEIYIAYTFLIVALVVINTAKFLMHYFLSPKHNKIVKLTIPAEHFEQKDKIISELKVICQDLSEIALEKHGALITLTVDLHVNDQGIKRLENYLVQNESLSAFSF